MWPISNFISSQVPFEVNIVSTRRMPLEPAEVKGSKGHPVWVNKEGHNLTNASSEGYTTFARSPVHLMRHNSTPSHETHALHRCSHASQECQLESTMVHLCLATMPNVQLSRNSSWYPWPLSPLVWIIIVRKWIPLAHWYAHLTCLQPLNLLTGSVTLTPIPSAGVLHFTWRPRQTQWKVESSW